MISAVRTFGRIERAQELVGLRERISTGTATASYGCGLLLAFASGLYDTIATQLLLASLGFWFAGIAYAQVQLNRLWRAVENGASRTTSGMRSVAQT